MQTKEFSASLDFLAKYLGILIFGSVLGLNFFLYVFLNQIEALYALSLMSIIAVVTLGIAYLYSPQTYIVSEDSIGIKRKAGIFSIKRNTIKSVEVISSEALGMKWRMMGNGGLFGYTGWYATKIGTTRWFVTQRKNYVLISTHDKKKIILSPDDVQGFVDATLLLSYV